MSSKLVPYQRYIFIGIVVVALGISFSTTLKESVGALGAVFIAVGGLFLIIGMDLKRKDQEKK